MAAASAIGGVNPFMQASPVNNATGTSGSSGSGSSTISANDFLTLLVSEMKNQDPTAQTDPNQYINQLVQVNSLEQLIQINQNLSTALGGSSTGGTGSGSGHAVSATAVPGAASVASGQPAAAIALGSSGANPVVPASGIGLPVTAGNLSVPTEIPAAHRVAQALSGRN